GIVILRLREPDRARPFKVPGGIVLPILGVVSCLYLIYYLPPTSWLRFAAWLNFGFVIYIGYGAVHSRLTGRQHSENPALHDAGTARTGAVLCVVGAALLLFMRGLDVWIDAAKNGEAPIAKVFSTTPWLEVSWFLIVPLTLNAFVLCPNVIIRAIRARKQLSSNDASSVLSNELVAIVIGAATVVYLLLVLRKHILSNPSPESLEVIVMADAAVAIEQKPTGFVRGLGLLDSTMIVAGSMIGSGIFIVSSEISRQVGAPGWLLVVWVVTGLLTLMAALSYGELAAMMPHAGGQYVYLREAFSPIFGFLYGWTLFMV